MKRTAVRDFWLCWLIGVIEQAALLMRGESETLECALFFGACVLLALFLTDRVARAEGR